MTLKLSSPHAKAIILRMLQSRLETYFHFNNASHACRGLFAKSRLRIDEPDQADCPY